MDHPDHSMTVAGSSGKEAEEHLSEPPCEEDSSRRRVFGKEVMSSSCL